MRISGFGYWIRRSIGSREASLKRKIRAWTTQDLVRFLCVVAVVSICCDIVTAFPIVPAWLSLLNRLGEICIWFLKALELSYFVALFVFRAARARRFLFNRGLGFYDLAAAYGIALAVPDQGGLNLMFVCALCACGFIRYGDADWEETEPAFVPRERQMFQSGLF